MIARVKDQTKVAKKKAWVLAKKRLTKTDIKLGGTELKLAKAESLNLA